MQAQTVHHSQHFCSLHEARRPRQQQQQHQQQLQHALQFQPPVRLPETYSLKHHSRPCLACHSTSGENPSQADLVAELAEAIRNEDYAAAAQARDALREVSGAQQLAVQSAFESFYQAFAACDMKAMERIWGHGDHIQCMHPQSQIVAGRDMVLESWKAIFQGAKGFPVELEDVRYSVGQTAAYVTCLERVGQGDRKGRIAATNIFEKQADGQWHLVLHQGGVC